MNSEVRTKVLEIKRLEDEAIDEVRKFVQDTSKKLDERWATFVQAQFGEYDPFIWHPKGLNRFMGNGGSSTLEKSMYSITEKNEVIETPYMIELLEAEIGIAYTVTKFEKGKFIKNEETVVATDVIALKEEILSEFIWSFKFDW